MKKMSVRKTITGEMEVVRVGLEKIARENRYWLVEFANKLDSEKTPLWKSRLIAIRNWLNHAILWAIFSLLLSLFSSCFVSGRTIHVATPRIDMSADTITAYTIPYNVTKSN